MKHTANIQMQEENDLQKITEQIKRNYKLFIAVIIIAVGISFLINKFSIPIYKVSSSILIKDEKNKASKINDNIKFDLFGSNQNFQNELEVLKSTPVMEQTIRKLDLQVSYYIKKNFQLFELYKTLPFCIKYKNDHLQPITTPFEITFNNDYSFSIQAKSKTAFFLNYERNAILSEKIDWSFQLKGQLNSLIETTDLSFIIMADSIQKKQIIPGLKYFFQFNSITALAENLKSQVLFDPVNKDATVIRMNIKTATPEKGKDILQGIMEIYTKQNLEKKNHLAIITIDYINQQLGEISDSLNQTEQKLQNFRSSNQLLNLNIQTTGITQQYQILQNQLAELVTRKRYFDNLENNLLQDDDLTNIAMPSSMGIQDLELNKQMGEFITAQAQKSVLLQNKQEKNPLVRKLSIQTDNLRKLISENIITARKTTELSIDELKKRIAKIEGDIIQMPKTERQLVGIERKFRLNDAIYNYMMEKRSEANINRASNLPDNEIVEPSKVEGNGPIFPNKNMNYLISLVLGIFLPISYLQLKNFLNNKIDGPESIKNITTIPILGKIFYNRKKTNNVVFDFPNSNIAESYRTLRTNLEYYVRGSYKKVIMITSSVQGEGKSFNALNIAMSYAQFGRKTILLDFDLRKPTHYFPRTNPELIGLSSYLINKANIEDIIIHSPHELLDYIPAGPTPPNPVELIGLEKTSKLIFSLKETYDYIIIDTPPLAQVTDAYLLLEYSDIKVLILRYNYTNRKVLAHVINDLHQKEIENVCLLLNDNRIYSDQYGYGYGYSKKHLN